MPKGARDAGDAGETRNNQWPRGAAWPMLSAMDLPPGLTSRPLRLADAEAVTDLVATAEERDVGEAQVELDDILGGWRRPAFDLSTESVGVWDGTWLVASGEVFRGRRADACVHPDWRGRRIGTALLAWTERVAVTRGSTLVGQTVPAGSGPARFLAVHGYQPLWTSWLLALPPGTDIPTRSLPPGYAMRGFVPGQDDRATFEVVENAFNEWPDRDPSTFEDWSAMTTGRPGFDPDLVELVVTSAGSVVGVAIVHVMADVAFVGQLAVRADHRRRGLAQALLSSAYTRARTAGVARCELATDSRTGALGLYEKVGMEVTHTWVHLAREPRA